MTTVCFISMKGGTGKTTLSVLFSYYLVSRKYSVLLVDMDPQGNATIAVAEDRVFDEEGFLVRGMPFILEGFLTPRMSSRELERVVRENILEIEPVKGRVLRLVPNFLESHKYDLHLVSNHAVPVFLREMLGCLDFEPDVVVMDCPPYLSSLSYSALFGAQVIVIPAEASKFGLVGVELILSVVEDVLRKRGEPFKDVVIQPNRIRNTKACSFYLEVMEDKYSGFLSERVVKETVEVPRMVRDGILGFSLQPSSQRKQVLEALASLEGRILGGSHGEA